MTKHTDTAPKTRHWKLREIVPVDPAAPPLWVIPEDSSARPFRIAAWAHVEDGRVPGIHFLPLTSRSDSDEITGVLSGSLRLVSGAFQILTTKQAFDAQCVRWNASLRTSDEEASK